MCLFGFLEIFEADVAIGSKNQPSLGQDSDHHTAKNLTIIGSNSCHGLYKNQTYINREDIFSDFAKDDVEPLCGD